MAKIVGAFCMPHDPYLTVNPPNTNQEQLNNVLSAFDRVAKRVAELKADTVITIGSDHYCMFGPQLIPAYAIGIGDLTGPMEPWMGVPEQVVNDNREMAQHILHYGAAHGFGGRDIDGNVLDMAARWRHCQVNGQNRAVVEAHGF